MPPSRMISVYRGASNENIPVSMSRAAGHLATEMHCGCFSVFCDE